MMFRARPFAQFLALLNLSMPDPLDQQKLHAHMQSQFDRIDPGSYARFLVDEELPFGPPAAPRGRAVLLQMGIGDAQVPNVGSALHARLLGVPQLSPSASPPLFGLSQAPFGGSRGLVVFDLGVDPSFYGPAAPAEDGNLVHDTVRQLDTARAQLARFFDDGVIEDSCGGPCQPAEGGL
jgi:hypothetical protein